MNQHENINCDSCHKSNFRGKRYKCLVCYDYDLCSACYEANAATQSHNTNHPVQCILTPTDYSLYYGGEAIVTSDRSYSYTCPFCGRMGFTITTLEEHVVSEHSDVGTKEVLCPICCSGSNSEPNYTTTDFLGHLTMEHNPEFKDLVSFLDDQPSARSSNARGHSATHRRGHSSRGRRANMQFNVVNSSSVSNQRNSSDPLAELLTQLTGVRRSTTNTTLNNHINLIDMEQFHMQWQIERGHARLNLENQAERRKKPVPISSASSCSSEDPKKKWLSEPNVTTKFLLSNVFVEDSKRTPERNGISNGRAEMLKQILFTAVQKETARKKRCTDQKQSLDLLEGNSSASCSQDKETSQITNSTVSNT